MPKLPVVKSKDLIKILKLLGFSEHRQRGTSHLVMKHTDKRRVIIPTHSNKDIPKGTLLAILKDTQITKDELLVLLN